MQWYYALNNQRQGPLSQAEFEKLVFDGVIKGDTLVWRQGMTDWQPYGAVGAGAAPAVGGDDTEICAVSGKRYPRREMIQYEGKWISAEHRDAYFQRLREGVVQPGDAAVPGPYGYGGFWRRFLARFIDSLITGVAANVVSSILGVVMGFGAVIDPVQPTEEQLGLFFLFLAIQLVVSFAIAIGYDVFFLRKFDATPGKMALGVKLLRADGSKLSVWRIVGRYFAHIISALPLAIGYIVAAFDDEKRAFHDRICDTRVIKTR